MARACRKQIMERKKNVVQKTHQIENPETSYQQEGDSTDDESVIYQLHHVSGKNSFVISLCVNDQNINFEIVTGSGVTIISEKHFNEKFKNTELCSTNVILKTYSREQLNIIVKFPVVIEHNGEVHNRLFIYVVKGTGSTLLGRDLLTKIKLNWFNVNHVKSSLNILLEQYSELFSDKLGIMKNYQAKSNIKEGAIPKFSKARNVPFAVTRSCHKGTRLP